MEQEHNQPVSDAEMPGNSVPWKFIDNWIGVALLALIDVVLFVITLKNPRAELAQSAAIVFLELAYLLPVALIFAWRRISWKYLGFGRFEWKTLGLGCGLVVVTYSIILLYGFLVSAFGIETQGERTVKMFSELDSPIWFFIAGVVVAPVVEEVFFRGFLFQGLRQRYGWISAMLLSSALFAVAHLDPVVLIPTFLLGVVLAYTYHRSNSVWPGIILHLVNNAFGLGVAYFAAHQNLIPL